MGPMLLALAVPFLAGCVAILTGVGALHRIRRSGGAVRGRAFAIAGIACGFVGLLVPVAGYAWVAWSLQPSADVGPARPPAPVPSVPVTGPGGRR